MSNLLQALKAQRPNGFDTLEVDAISLLESKSYISDEILNEFRPHYNTKSSATLEEFAAFWILEVDGLSDSSFGERAYEVWNKVKAL